MSREQEAGRELDALVAERVMGQPAECTLVGEGTAAAPLETMPADGVWRVRSPKDHFWHRWSPDGAERVVNDFSVPRYSTDIAAAFEVVEKVRGRVSVEVEFELYAYEDGRWDASFGIYENVIAETAPLAICRAALRATATHHDSEVGDPK